jgi:hypothetical protein
MVVLPRGRCWAASLTLRSRWAAGRVPRIAAGRPCAGAAAGHTHGRAGSARIEAGAEPRTGLVSFTAVADVCCLQPYSCRSGTCTYVAA